MGDLVSHYVLLYFNIKYIPLYISKHFGEYAVWYISFRSAEKLIEAHKLDVFLM